MFNSIKSALVAAGAVTANTYYQDGKFEATHTRRHGPRKARATNETLHIHLIAHTHDDVGWLKTVDDYFDGSRRDLQWTNVEITITTVVEALLQDSSRKFSQVEMKFFSMWYSRLSTTQ